MTIKILLTALALVMCFSKSWTQPPTPYYIAPEDTAKMKGGKQDVLKAVAINKTPQLGKITIRYKVNDRVCTTVIKVPYQSSQ